MRSLILVILLCPFCLNGQDFKTYQAADNLYLVGDRTFSLFYITDDQVIVIDPINENHAKATQSAIDSLTTKHVTHVFYSHNHWDHISGATVFLEQGAEIHAHENAARHIAPNPNVIMPDVLWSGDRKNLSIGGKVIELYHYGRSHGNGLTTFRFPEHNAVFIIDLVVPDRVLYAYLPDADPSKWRTHLQLIQELEFDMVLMSHVRPIGDRSDIQLVQDYFDDLYKAVDTELKAGTPFFDIPRKVRFPQYQHLKNYEQWLPMNVWRILMEKSIGQ